VKNTVALVTTMLLAALLTACANGATPPVPTSEPDIRGVITSIEPSAGEATSIRVVWADAPGIGTKAAFDAAQVAIVDETDVRKRASDEDEPISAADLKLGDIVEAWFTGPVAESYPVQVTAATIVVTGSYDGTLPVPPGLEPEPVPPS